MLLVIGSVIAVTTLLLLAVKYKDKISLLLSEIRYETWIQLVGVWAVVDDHLQREWNKDQMEKLSRRDGEVVVITGGARGIGVEVVKELLNQGMKVVMGVRRPDSARKVIQQLKKDGYPDNVDVYELNVASMKSVARFGETVRNAYPEISVLINNAGIMYVRFALTEEGFESQLATNYLGHFYLTHLLLANLKRAGEKMDHCARVVNVSSCAHFASEILFDDMSMKEGYISSAAYSQSKLAQIMFARHLNERLEIEEDKVKCYSLHPGVVNTELFDDTPIGKYGRFIMNWFFKTPKEGAMTVLFTALSPKVEKRGGLYVSNCRQGPTNNYSKDKAMQKKLFEVTCEMLNIKEYGVV